MQIDVTNATELFSTHFEEPSNDRILFSGRFGSGKTYFLDSFFKGSESTTFRISPVNYSISSNENIFECIKFDLVMQLLKSFDLISNEKTEFKNNLLIQQYLIYHTDEALKTLVDFLGNFDEKAKVISESWTKLLELNSNFNKFKDKHRQKSETEKAINFLEFHSMLKGSIYEDDLITQIIRQAINHLKTKENNLITLVVDDLDRLDPEHIFRILNVFSAHNNNYYESKNKFDFDKIIIVCDIDNIQRAFEHRYGIGLDFEGYIDKFYSNDIFRFDNNLALLYFCDSYIAPLVKDENAIFLLKIILKEFVRRSKLNVRNIIKSKYFIDKRKSDFFREFAIIKSSFHLKDAYSDYRTEYHHNVMGAFDMNSKEFYVSSNDISFLNIIRILSIMMGDYNRLKLCIQDLIKNNSNSFENSQTNNENLLKSLYLIFHIAKHIDNPIEICYDISIESLGNNSFRSIANLPNVYIFNKKFSIQLPWKYDNKYRGDCSYFKGAELNLRNNISESINIKTSDIFEIIYEIITTLEKGNILNKIGITGK
ncbi:hypothetical protein GO755_04605 [Spirosoma sp. HMF4905]|uniref:KAP NTPase domain-containing protein n=1 Tax=Spirosoma arboris TaxID=2682092 RepID=A0A7K1S666_9BACT|nr:P-loop NTPase fold protein [Spirosoma arboris]MVM29303.1 hypothetical protein [Spirosoma arboris]